MKKYKWVQWAICFIIGHDVEWVIEHRLRYGHISLNRKGGKKRNQSRWVAGADIQVIDEIRNFKL